MWLITQSRLANADMIRAVGSILTRSYENSFVPGLMAHFTVGILIAFVYAAFFELFPVDSIVAYSGLGAMMGTMHGLAVTFTLVIMVAEHHPLEQFRQAGAEVAIAHMVGHIVYGLIVGAVIGIAGPELF